MPFTKMDKALMDRAARNLTEQAKQVENSFAVPLGWGVNSESKKAKLDYYDRLMRDARDLRALAKRSMPAKQLPIEL